MADIKVTAWQMKAKLGDATAMNNLGLAYRDGAGVEKNPAESAKWFYKGATAGNLDATYNMAIAYLSGQGVQADKEEGLKWLGLAAELGHPEAMLEMYAKYYNGQDVKKDLDKAFYWLEKTAESGNVKAMKDMASAYRSNNYMTNVEADDTKAVAWTQKAAIAGNVESMFNLGYAYEFGEGIEKDLIKAVEWYQRAVDEGYTYAKTQLGYLYFMGQGVEQDYARAVQLFRSGAADGDGRAMYRLGYAYANGQGIEKDLVKAAEWYKKGADKGNKTAMYYLGNAYMRGEGVEKNYSLAAECAKKLAEAGTVDSMKDYGDMLWNGIGVEQDRKKAVDWYKKAADGKNAIAMMRLGCAYQDGVGVDKDLKQAERFFRLAVQHGKKEANVYLAQNMLLSGRGSKVAKEALELLQMEECKGACKDYDELVNKAERMIAYEEHFKKMMYEKFGAEITEQSSEPLSAMAELEQMIGLRKVKEEVRNLKALVEVQQKMLAMGKEPQKISLHMVFTGNPGTGKTTVARIIARVFHEIGVIPTDKLVECDRTSLVGQYIGETAPKTQAVIDSAIGGVLFIDEAYTLSPKDSPRDFGPEAINTLLKAMEDHRDNLIVIVAGYTKEMKDFIDTNPGLQSRFNLYLDFEDYTVAEMIQIFKHTCDRRDYYVDDDAWKYVIKTVTQMVDYKSANFANGRDARNLFENVLKKQNVRISQLGIDTLSEMDFFTIMKEDITDGEEEEEENITENQQSALAKLDAMIGLDSVKEEVLNLKKKIVAQKKLRELGRNVEKASLHMVFTGNPGTGKTTVARIIAQVFHEIGVIPTDKLVECDRSSLVGRYIGETAPKTQAVIDSAIGGVLFIDEAYTLSPQDSPRDFGPEAINTLLKAMEDHRDTLIVIVAGYKNEMQDFLATNPGLQSRFKYFIDFPDYNQDEMFKIFKSYCKKEQYEISEEALLPLKSHFAKMEAEKEEKFGNGREVRNFYERVVQRVLVRFAEIGEDATEDDLVIRAEDVIES